MVEKVKKTFPHVIVVMNVGGIVDTKWFRDCDEIQSVLMAWQGGMEGGLATADILCGDVNPSGKLSDTYAKDLEEDLKNAIPDRVFITHSECDAKTVEEVRDYIASLGIFKEIIETRAGGVISSHCGPGTLGVLFIAK